MTPVAFTLSETSTIGEAARRMLADNVHAVPVTSADGHVTGVLSATDIVAWVATPMDGTTKEAAVSRDV